MKRFRSGFQVGQKNLLIRLLGPISLVSFITLIGLVGAMLYGTHQSVSSSLNSKADSVTSLLADSAAIHIPQGDKQALEMKSRNLAQDQDFSYIAFSDADGAPIYESGAIPTEYPKESRVTKDIKNDKGIVIGSVTLILSQDREFKALKFTAIIGICGLLITQVLLSIALYFVARGVIRPLQDSLTRLSNTAQVLGTTSSDISKFSEALSNGVNQQAEVVQQTTAAMAEMSSMLSQTSNYAKQSENVMSTVTQRANNGMNIMNQMVEAMSSVQQANEQLSQMSEIIAEIGNKTNVINDIVFKTQLLSFNAAIEAARAGAHGKGFAVVAEEVGNLAKLSGTAAQDIASLLQDSERQVNDIVKNTGEKVSTGRHVTEQALKNFKEIANDINLISSHFVNISSASHEQELGVAQTNQAMGELNKTTELNNQVAQRASDTSRVLSSEIQSLHEISRSIEESIAGRVTSAAMRSPLRGPRHRKTSVQPMKVVSQNSQEDSAPSDESTDESGDFDSVADKIVELAKKQRRDSKNKKHNVG